MQSCPPKRQTRELKKLISKITTMNKKIIIDKDHQQEDKIKEFKMILMINDKEAN